MKVLIIGLGRAGRRHKKQFRELGYLVTTTDSYVDGADYWDLDDALLHGGGFDAAVVCSPPHLHLKHVRTCLDRDVPKVLVEKPLCGWGQLAEAEKLAGHVWSDAVMPAFNYRWHPDLMALKKKQVEWASRRRKWKFYSVQYRPELPEWGLALDHLPHTLDLLRWLGGDDVMVKTAWGGDEYGQTWAWVNGSVDGIAFEVYDKVVDEPMAKEAWIDGPFGKVTVNTGPEIAGQVFRGMADAFLAGPPFPVTLDDALACQRLLEECKARAGGTDGKVFGK